MAGTNLGRVSWNHSRDKEGHREYTVTHRVRTSDVLDGPAVAAVTPGIPLIGSTWAFGNDLDSAAFCHPDQAVTLDQHKKGDPHLYWLVKSLFSTKPLSRCQDESVDDPLLEPQKLSGSFVKYVQQATQDKDGNIIESSSHERFEGPDVERDYNRPTVRVEQNVAQLGIEVFSQMVDTVNTTTLWGLAPRTIKLSNASWERRINGSCGYYFTRVFEFDIDFTTFDREVADSGFKHFDTTLAGGSRANPDHYIRHKDRHDENDGKILLDGNGSPRTGAPFFFTVKFYAESNFLLLGIPTNFG